MSQLPISGVLDRATLHQMTLPRCGVADADSHAAWAERISALFAGRRAKMRRKKRFAKPGECIEIQLGRGSPGAQKIPRPKTVAELMSGDSGRKPLLPQAEEGRILWLKDHNQDYRYLTLNYICIVEFSLHMYSPD